MLEVSTAVVIAAPSSQVSAFAAEPANAAAWYAHVRAGRWLAPGERFELVAAMPLGRTVRLAYDVVESQPGRRLTFRTAQGPLPMTTTYLWTARGPGATEMVLHNRAALRRPVRPGARLVAWAMRRANRADLERLKALLEAGDGTGRPDHPRRSPPPTEDHPHAIDT
jgi:uncharacterized membrane protein